MTPRRPRFVDPNARIFPVEAAEIVGISYQRLNSLMFYGKLPAPIDGRYVLRDFLRAYIQHVATSAFSNGIDSGFHDAQAWRRAQRPPPPADDADPTLQGLELGDVW